MQHWLQLRFPNLNIQHLIALHNRVTIPLEEDLCFLRRLRVRVHDAEFEHDEEALKQELKNLEEEHARIDQESKEISYDFMLDHPCSTTLGGMFYGL